MTNSTLKKRIRDVFSLMSASMGKGRFLSLMVLLLATAVVAKANPIGLSTAREVGAKFINANTKMTLANPNSLRLVTTYNTSDGTAAFHVFNTERGFVIVAADDCSIPILAYSEEGPFDVENIPEQMEGYLQVYQKEIQYGIEHRLSADETIDKQWNMLRTTGRIFGNRSTTAVEPLLTETWNQNCYYNALCPEDSNGPCGHVYAGCVATAMGQIMHFWQYPVVGSGSHTYYPDGYPEQTANFGATTYDWVNMPNNLNSSSSSTQINAVATLLWHCGIAVNMMYSANGSGAYSVDVPYALTEYFNYSEDLFGQYKEDNASWLSLIKTNLDLGLPIYYSGSDVNGAGGHAFVCDGYDANDYLHFNWGWSGSGNAYFAIDALNVGNYQFNNYNYAIFNIRPQTGNTYQITTVANPAEGGIVTGNGTYYEGRLCTLTAVSGYDYNFVNWTKDGVVVSTDPTYSFMVTEDATYVANFALFEGVTIGSGTATNEFLPSYSYYCYTLSEQIYTSEDLDMPGAITSLAFYNAGEAKTRVYDIYMVNTEKTYFENSHDWITPTAEDLVFSGTVTMASGMWTTFVLDNPFVYDGTNFALIVDDNTGSWTDSPHMACRVFGTESMQAMRIYSDSPDYDPFNPTQYEASATYYEKNQIRITLESLTASTPMVNPDPIDLGYRPNGAWMPPYTFNLYNPGNYTTINSMSSTNPYFQLDTEGLSFPFNLGYHGNRDIKVNWGTGGGQINGLLNINYGDNENVQYSMTAHAYTPVSPDVWELAQTVNSFPFTATLNSVNHPLYNNYRLPPTGIVDGADAVYKLVFTEDTYLNASVTSGEDGKVALYPEGFYGEGGPDLNNNYTAPEMSIEDWLHYDNGEYYESWYTNWGDCIWGIKFSPDQLAAYANCNLTKISVFDSNSNSSLSTYTINIYVGGDTPDEGMLVHTQDFEPYADNTFHEVFLTEAIDIDPSQNLWITLHAQANGGYPIACCRNVEDPNGRWYYYESSWTEFTGYNDAAWMVRGFVTNQEGRTMALGNRDAFDVTIGEGTSTTGYLPMYYLYNYSLSTQLFLASELAEVGANTSFINKLSWYSESTYGYNVQNVSIWMANVTDNTVSSVSPLGENMTLVYQGNFQEVVGWNEFEFNQGSFAWDGLSNVMVMVQMNNGSWSSSIQWQCHDAGFNAGSYVYQDSAPYSAETLTYNMNTTTNRANTRFTFSNDFEGEINNMTVTPGTYYLVASSTSDEWTVEINTDEVPCPDFAYSPYPANYAEVNPNRTIELSWQFGPRTTEYKLMFGTTESCEQTLVDWTRELSRHYTLPALLDDMTYYWKIMERNDGCSEGVESPVWSFTTRLNTPQNLYAEQDFIMEGNSAVLYWSAPNRALQYYNVYQDGMLIGSTTDTYYVVDGLNYNMNGYAFYVTGVFDAGESDPSNYVWVYVSGLGTVNGHVYEQDGTTGIANAMVSFTGYDEYGYYNTYSFTTDDNGYYEGSLRAGSYVAIASHGGYQDKSYGSSIAIVFNNLTSGININLDEVYKPVTEVIAEYYPDAENPESPYVKVNWSNNLSGWHTYCESEFNNAVSSNVGQENWAYEYPLDVLEPYIGSRLTKVALFSDNMYGAVGGNYTCTIYVGGEVPEEGTAVSTITVDVPQYMDEWVEYDLIIPVSVTGNDPIWVVWTANTKLGGYPAGCCDGINDLGTWWRGGDGYSWEHLSYGTWTMKNYFSTFGGRTVALTYNPSMLSNANANCRNRSAVTHSNNSGAQHAAINPNPERVPLKVVEPDRSFQYYRVYRTNAYNNGPYTEDNTVLIADNVTDSILIDITWQDANLGVYKWGVSCVYEGNRESEISWGELNQLNPMPNRSSRQYQATEGTTRENLVYDFNDSSLQGWTTIDADGDGYTWVSSATPGVYHNSGVDLTGTGHNGSAHYVISASWANGLGQVLYPDNYLVSPQIALGGSISFWACAQDASYAADHFGVAVSTSSNTNPNTFVTIQEWTMTTKGTSSVMSFGRNGNTRDQGNWYQYTVDLSAYAGQSGYVAIRHFNCSDQFILNIDDVEITASSIQSERESAITWSNVLDKDMYLNNGDVNLTVALNSGDSPAGTMVSFTNLNTAEQQLYPIAAFVLDGSGYYAWNSFRKGDYQVTITKEGYETISEQVSIWDATSLSYVLDEITQAPTNLYVSSTGWAKWNGMGDDLSTITVLGDSFYEDFENGLPENWLTIDGGNPSGYGWQLGSVKLNGSGYGHNGSNELMISQSYDNNYGVVYPDNYLITPQVHFGNSSVFCFYACAQDASYAAEHFGVAISTTGNTTASDFTTIQEWTMTAKSGGAPLKGNNASRGGVSRSQGNWYYFTVDLSAYAGQNGYIAIRHFNCSDMFYLNVDDVELTNGTSGGRHYEYNQVVLTDMQNNVLYTENTTNKYCQLPVNNLVEGQTYHCKVASVYSSGLTEWAEVDWVYQSCDNYEGASELVATTTGEGNLVSWTYPEFSESKNLDNREMWDLMATFNAAEVGQYGVAYDGNNFYTSNWGYSSATHNFYKYDLLGNMLEGFEIANCGTLRGITFDGQYFYGVANSDMVYCVDLANHTLVSTFTSAYGTMRGITYDPVRNGFWVIGNWSGNLTLIDRTGAIVQVGPEPESVSDLAYYKDENDIEHVFCFNNGDNGVYDYNIMTNTLDGSMFNFSSTPGFNSGSSGGCTVGDFNGKMAFIGDIQQDPNLIGIYELRDAIYAMSPVGAMVYRDNELVGFTRNSSYLDEGNTSNHQYTIRVVYGGPAICPDNNIYYSMSCPQTVEIGGGSEITQTTNFSQGWNWWSTYIDQQGIDGLTTLEDGLGANGVQIKSQTNFVTNYGVFWMGMLQSINNDESYMIQTNAACQVEMSGLPVSPANHPITINQGWNWIGYPCTNTMSVTQAFANYTPMNGDQVKSQSDYAMYFSGIWIGQLQNITPGMGLMYKSNNTAPMTLVYPNAGRNEEAVAPKDLHWTNDVHAYPNNMTVLATVELDGVELRSESYELAAFADGECRGSAKLMFVEPLNRHIAFLTIAGDEAVELTFALYDGENNVEYFDSDSRLVFTTNAVVGNAEAPFVVSFRGTTGLDELDNNVQIFPNPVQAGERISILTTVDSKHPIRVEIVNALGATVAYETSKDTPASIVAPMTSGIYTVRIITEDKGMQCRKLIVR